MNRSSLRRLAYAFSQTDEANVDQDLIDTMLDEGAQAFARDVGGVHYETSIVGVGGTGRKYSLPAGTNRVLAAYFIDGSEFPLIEGDTTNSHGLNRLRDPDFHSSSAGRPSYYVVEQSIPPAIWFDNPIPLGMTVKLTIQINSIEFGQEDDDEPRMPASYHEAIAYFAARLAAYAVQREEIAEQRDRQYQNLVSKYQQERSGKQPSGIAFRPAPGLIEGVGGGGRFGGIELGGRSGGSSMATLDQVYRFMKMVLRGRPGVTLTPDDSANEIGIGAGISALNQGVPEGDPHSTEALNFTGNGVSATYNNGTTTVTIEAGAGFLEDDSPASDQTVTTPAGSNQGGWSPWLELSSVPALTAEKAGRILLIANIYGTVQEAAVGGGDRMMIESQLRRTRGSTTEVLEEVTIYGPRNIAAAANQTSTVFAAASKNASELIVIADDAQAGDVYSTRVRVIAQRTSGTRSIMFDAAHNILELMSLGGAGGGGGGGLTHAQRDAIGKAIEIGSMRLSDRDLAFDSDDGTAGSVTLPGISVRKDGALVGDVWGISELNFVGTTVSATAAGNRATLTFTSGSGDGVTQADVERLVASNAQLQELEEFETAMRTRIPMVDRESFQQALSNAAAQVHGNAVVPSATGDNELIVTIGTNDPYRIDVKDLLAKQVAQATDQLTESNSITWTQDGTVYHIGREGGEGSALLFAADSIGTYSVTIVEDRIDIQSWARVSSSATIPGAKLDQNQRLPAPRADKWLKWDAAGEQVINVDAPAGTPGPRGATGRTGPTGPAGPRGADGDPADITTLVEPYALLNTTDRLTEARLPIKLDDILDAFDLAGWARAPADEARLATTLPTSMPGDTAAAAALTYTLSYRRDVTPARVNANAVMRFTDEAAAERSEYTLTIQSASGHVENRLDLGSVATIGSAGGFTYYNLVVADIPAEATLEIQKYSPFRLNTKRVKVVAPSTVEVIDGAGPGLSPTGANDDQKTFFTHPTEPFDLDDADKQHGIVNIGVRVTMSNPGNIRMGFAPHIPTTANTHRVSFGYSGASASTLRALPTYISGDAVADIKGDLVHQVPVYHGGDQVGSVVVYLSKNAENELGIVLGYDGSTAVASSNFSIATRVVVSFTPFVQDD